MDLRIGYNQEDAKKKLAQDDRFYRWALISFCDPEHR